MDIWWAQSCPCEAKKANRQTGYDCEYHEYHVMNRGSIIPVVEIPGLPYNNHHNRASGGTDSEPFFRLFCLNIWIEGKNERYARK